MTDLPGLNDAQIGVINELNSVDQTLWDMTEYILSGDDIGNGDVTVPSGLEDLDIFDDAGNITSGGLFAVNQVTTILNTHSKAVTSAGQAEENNRKNIGDMTSR